MLRSTNEAIARHRSQLYSNYNQPVLYGLSDSDSEDLDFPINDLGMPLSPFTMQFDTQSQPKTGRWAQALNLLGKGFSTSLCWHQSGIDGDNVSTSSRVQAAKPLVSTDEPMLPNAERKRSESLVSRLSHELRVRVVRR